MSNYLEKLPATAHPQLYRLIKRTGKNAVDPDVVMFETSAGVQMQVSGEKFAETALEIAACRGGELGAFLDRETAHEGERLIVAQQLLMEMGFRDE